jgi:hypothetical protein
MTSTMETHPPVRTLAMVRTGASKVEIISPQNAGLDFQKSTYVKRSRQFGTQSR